ncbi:TetR family transcriptional regulator [Leptolinea sp. HRD-7]|nr:TetR family transcriptional regulator [Leptolinea sp. HRD-7]
MNRQQQKENTRRKLLDTALDVFSRNGITATRMSDIAEAAGVSHGTVFLHFESQEVLISAVIEDFGFRMASRTHELSRESGSVKEILAAHLRGIQEHESFYSRLVKESSHLPIVARIALTDIQSAVSFHISRAAEREMAAGTIKRMPVALLFNTWVGLIHYYLSNADQFAPGESVIESCGSMLLEHFMRMISIENQ